MHVIEMVNLTKTYKGKKGLAVAALKGLDLTIAPGEIFGFLGPNGAGKSTTIKILMGLIKPTGGHATIMGEDVVSHLSRKKVGYLPENPAFYDYLSATEYLKLVGMTFGMLQQDIDRASARVLELLDLWDARQRAIRSYSKGMVQRLGIAQALLHDPEVFVFDEPMSGLDPLGRALVKDVMLDLKKNGKAVFFSTHIIPDVESVCDRVGIITKGTLQRVESVKSLSAEGVSSYLVRLEDPTTGIIKDLQVGKEELPRVIADIQKTNQTITLIEPQRKTLESFFLDVVKEQK